MTTRLYPEVGHWYAHRDKGQLFQVVAFDADDGSVEIQDFDGDVDEVDLDTWFALPLDAAEAPEDWTGPVDDVETDDLGYASATEMGPRDWQAARDEFPAQFQAAVDADESDDEPVTTH